jgi:hypothetical protein
VRHQRRRAARGKQSKRRRSSAPARPMHPWEREIARLYEGIPLPNLQASYEEAKFTFSEQLKAIDHVAARATWLVATAVGLVLAVVSQAKNIADLRPPPLIIGGFVLGVIVAVGVALAALWAAQLFKYDASVKMADLSANYPTWDPDRAKIRWLQMWRSMFAKNEQIRRRRVMALQLALASLTVAVIIVLVSSLSLIVLEATKAMREDPPPVAPPAESQPLPEPPPEPLWEPLPSITVDPGAVETFDKGGPTPTTRGSPDD